jgi:hypothetical protein
LERSTRGWLAMVLGVGVDLLEVARVVIES